MTEVSLFSDDPSAGQRTYTVAALANELARTLREQFGTDVWVQGELRNLNRSSTGHVYFDLVDPPEGGESPAASVSVVLFRKTKDVVNRMLASQGGVRMTDGLEVRIRGAIDFYAPQGRLQIRMTGIDPSYTIGRLAADRERLLATLRREDLLERNARLPFPVLPLRVALVTSAGSAACHDFLAELERSGLAWEVALIDTRVQGLAAVDGICRALQRAGAHGDVIALVRGGGARTDLAAFDHELVARAIATSATPIITGIGHEIDRCVADEVAARSFKTPTAAAASLVDAVLQQRRGIDVLARRVQQLANAAMTGELATLGRQGERAHRAVGASVRRAGDQAEQLAERLVRVAPRRLRSASVAVDDVALRVSARPGRAIAARRDALARGESALATRARRRVVGAQLRTTAGTHLLARHAPRPLAAARTRLAVIDATVRALDPARLLARGWSITRDADGTIIRRVADVDVGDAVAIELSDGAVGATVVGRTEPDEPTTNGGTR
ncbi:MAG: exodeoxyribonuclease VII large subunit [Acidimicrobiia bacterium]|nr:exodeoxyribonuclease VII large subunit [Acidimicrobiia bacterium]